MPFAIKAEIIDPQAEVFEFRAPKTMYGGKLVTAGDEIFVFASENTGGAGLVAAGLVTAAHAVARVGGSARQTPRVSLTVRRTAGATRAVGRRELKLFSDWTDGRPETELNFKFYRQATDKVVGISAAAAAFLRGCCGDVPAPAAGRVVAADADAQRASRQLASHSRARS